MRDSFKTLKAEILDGEAKSTIIDLWGYKLVSIYMPGEWTTADLKLEASPTGADDTFNPVYDEAGDEIEIPVAADRVICIGESAAIASLRFVKLVSTNTQGDDREITLIVKG